MVKKIFSDVVGENVNSLFGHVLAELRRAKQGAFLMEQGGGE